MHSIMLKLCKAVSKKTAASKHLEKWKFFSSLSGSKSRMWMLRAYFRNDHTVQSVQSKIYYWKAVQ
jgi:hypothetical protein